MFKNFIHWISNIFKKEFDLPKYRIIEKSEFISGRTQSIFHIQILSNKGRWRYFSYVDGGGSNNYMAILNYMSEAKGIAENYMKYLNSNNRDEKIIFEMDDRRN